MSMTRISNAPGRDSWRDDGPAFAAPGPAFRAEGIANMQRVVTDGGTFLSYRAGTGAPSLSIKPENRIVRPPKPRGITYAPEPKVRPLCGFQMRTGASCERSPGHRSEHKDRVSLEMDAARRRKHRPVAA